MAKKKTSDKKGLAGIPVYGSNAKTGKDIRLNKKVKPKKVNGVVNYLGNTETITVPKQWLSSPDHVVAELAYITPAEQKILIDANLYGSLDGKPNRAPGGLMSLQGDFGGGSYGGGAGDDKAGTDSAADSARDSGDSGSSSSFDDDGGDDDYSSVTPSMRQQEITPSYDPSAQDEEQTSAITIQSDDGDFLSPEGRSALNVLAQQQIAAQDTKLPGLLGALGSFANRRNISAMQNAIQRGGIPTYATANRSGQQFVRYVTLPNGQIVGTAPTPIGGGDDDGGRGLSGVGQSVLQAGETTPPAVTPDSYYQRGVGTATMDLADAAQRDAFLAGLYGTTPSPVGSRFDKEKGLLYLPDGTVVDIKTGQKIKEKRISGLDIFKPLQTYA